MSNETDGSDDDEIGGVIPTRLLGAEVFALDLASEVGMLVIESDAFNRTAAESYAMLEPLSGWWSPGVPERATLLRATTQIA